MLGYTETLDDESIAARVAQADDEATLLEAERWYKAQTQHLNHEPPTA